MVLTAPVGGAAGSLYSDQYSQNFMLRPPPQFWDRIKLYMMPSKHQPDFSYLRHVPLRKVHLFTLVQITCLAVLWILKSTFLAIIFPVMVRERTYDII